MKKYIVYGDFIISRTDGQMHYITAYTTMRLYGLNERECILIDRDRLDKARELDTSKFISLYPDYAGKYELNVK